MKKFTKIMIGAGLTVAALGAAAAPATAATTSESTSSAGTAAEVKALVGAFSVYSGAQPLSAPTYWHFNANETLTGVVNDPSQADKVAFPLVGDTGPVRVLSGVGAGKCVGIGPIIAGGKAVATLVDCAMAPLVKTDANYYVTSIDTGRWLTDGAWGDPAIHNPKGRDSLIPSKYKEQVIAVPGVVVPVDVTGPAAGSTVDTKNPTFSGTGDEGATVVVKDENGQELCRTTVVGGVWSCVSAVDLPDGPHKAVADQTATDGSTSSDSVDFIVADGAGGPVMDPMIAGGAGLVLVWCCLLPLVRLSRSSAARAHPQRSKRLRQ